MTNGPTAGRARFGRPGRRGGARGARGRLGLCAGRLRRRPERRRGANRTRAHRRSPRPLGRFSQLPRPWAQLRAEAAPLRSLRLIDDTGRSFRRARSNFTPRKSGSTRSAGISKTTRWPNARRRGRSRSRPRACGQRRRLRVRAPTPRGRGWKTAARSRPGSSSAPTAGIRKRAAPPGSRRAPTLTGRAR